MKINNQYFILRHGETIYQAQKIERIYSWPEKSPIKLSQKGEREIKKIAKLFKKKKIDLIYSSDIYRARQTAEILASELGLKINPIRELKEVDNSQDIDFSQGVNFDSRLRDINFGIYQSKSKKEFYRDYPVSKRRFYQRPKAGESWNDVKKRMVNFLKEIDKKPKGKTILIVSHGDPLWLLEGTLKGLSNEEMLREKLENGTIKVGELRKLNF